MKNTDANKAGSLSGKRVASMMIAASHPGTAGLRRCFIY